MKIVCVSNSSAGAPPPPLNQHHHSSVTLRPKPETVMIKTNNAHKLLAPSPPPPSSLAVALCNMLDDMIDKRIDPPGLRPSVDPTTVLTGNFHPVDELRPTPCPVVVGSIPPCLRGGAYLRNGPNPQHVIPHRPYHLFDGDGMLHSLLLPTSDSGTAAATLCSRYVRTYRHELERRAGRPVLPNTFSGLYGAAGVARLAVSWARVMTGQTNPVEGIGLANTSLVFFNGELHALGESDLPYTVHLSVKDGDLTTIGRQDLGRNLSSENNGGMTAHPKKDPVTGEMFAFRYGQSPPYITYFWFDRDGNKSPDVPISVECLSPMHDFAITENYAVFAENQLVVKPLDMIVRNGSPLVLDHSKVPRIGVLPRYASSESEMRWFDVPGFGVVHTVNAWEEEEGNVVVLVAPNVLQIEHAILKMELARFVVEMVRIDMRTGAVERTPMSESNLEFGVIHPGYVGRKNRYAYFGVGDQMPKFSGVVKMDFEKVKDGGGECVVARREFGPGKFGGEPTLVPARLTGEEDDEGYLVCFVHDEMKGESRFVVMDAQSPELEIVAEVLLPRRVPYGFHGLFVSEAELLSQKDRD